MRGTERTVAVVGNGGLDGELGIAVGDTAGVTLDLAQRVGVLAGLVVGDLAHRDLAVGGVLAGGDDLGALALALDELEGELAGLEVAAGQDLLRGNLVSDAGLVRCSVVLVLKACCLGTLERMGHLKRTVAVVDDARLDGVVRLIVRDPVAQPRLVGELLAQRVGVGAGLVVSDLVHGNRAVGSVSALGNDLVALDELEGELTLLEVAAVQDLGRGDLVLDRLHAIGVLELGLARDLFNVSLKPTRGLNRHGHFERGNVLAVGDATGVALDLADLIGVLARLVEGDPAEVNGGLALAVRVGFAHGRVRGCRHRSVILGRRGELKLKLVRIRPAAALEHLGQAKAGLGIHRCRRHVKADLAVVAQVRIHVRGRRNGGKVIPPRVKHVARGLGHIAAHVGLGGMQLVDIGKARGSLVKGPVAVLFDQSAVVVGDLVPFKHHNGIVVLRLKVFAHRHKLVLVIIDAATLRLYRRALGACLVRVDGRDLLEVIVAVGIGGLKLGNNIAQLAARPLVGQEVDRLLVGVLVRVDIVLEPVYLIWCKQVVARVVFDARGVFNLNRLDVIERRALKDPVFHVHVIADQRNQRCGNLDRHDIALLRVVRTRDGDDQVLGNTQKLICVHIALGGPGHLVNGFAINLSADKRIDLHKVAQLITKGDVAGLALVVTILDLSGRTLARGDRARDIIKHLLELIGIRRSLVEIGILGALTKLIGCVGRGVWIVARHGVHEPVFFACLANGLIRVRTAKDADGVDGGAFIFHGLGGINGIISDIGLKTIRTCRRAVGKEHDDLLGIRAARHVASKLKAVISLRSAGRLDGADRILKFRRSAIDTRRQALHNLRIVIFVPAIRTVTDIVALCTGKLDNRNLMLFGIIFDLCVLFGDGVDKGTGSCLECLDTFGRTLATHGIAHRPGGIKHHHDIERFSDQRRCVRSRRHRGKRRHKVRLFVLRGLNRLVRPDSAYITCRLVLLAARRPVLPTAGGVRIDCLCRCRSVHSGAGPGVGLGQHGKCCGRQYQHNGQYHRQEAPRVLTHRVSLLAGSNLASA